jgi:hypothetical protein
MRQETRAIMGMVGEHRISQMRKRDPALDYECTVDGSGERAVVKVTSAEGLVAMDFIESEATAGKVENMDDYIAVASMVHSLGIMFPEKHYPRDMASSIFQSIVSEVRRRSGIEFQFNGYVYDDMGNVKPVR